eukprot:5458631-Prymnesium_polylepis.1
MKLDKSSWVLLARANWAHTQLTGGDGGGTGGGGLDGRDGISGWGRAEGEGGSIGNGNMGGAGGVMGGRSGGVIGSQQTRMLSICAPYTVVRTTTLVMGMLISGSWRLSHSPHAVLSMPVQLYTLLAVALGGSTEARSASSKSPL